MRLTAPGRPAPMACAILLAWSLALPALPGPLSAAPRTVLGELYTSDF